MILATITMIMWPIITFSVLITFSGGKSDDDDDGYEDSDDSGEDGNVGEDSPPKERENKRSSRVSLYTATRLPTTIKQIKFNKN